MGALQLDVQLCGRERVLLDGAPPARPWPRPAARRLVTLLVLAPTHRLSRDELADHLVGHLAPDRAARAVSKALSQARSVLGDHVLEATRGSIWIHDRVELHCDLSALLAELRGLTTAPPGAAALEPLVARIDAAGPALVDDAYEDWAVAVLDEYARLSLLARLRWAREVDSVHAWSAVAEADPTCEEAAIALAGHAARSGQPQGGRAALLRCCAALEELGLPASSTLRDALARADGGSPTTSGVGSPLFGRRHHLDGVHGALQRGHHVLVSGPAGIGKSRLLAEVVRSLTEQGWQVGVGVAVPEDALAPMAALRTAVRSLVPARLDPFAGGLPSGGRPTGSAGDRLAQLADAIDQALARLPERALVVVDDLHWADADLQQLLVRLASRQPTSWSLLLAGRSDDPGARLPDLPTGVCVEALRELEPGAAAALVRGTAPRLDDVAVDHVVTRGGGNPFFLAELARTTPQDVAGIVGDRPGAPDAVPAAVLQLIRRRLEPVDAAPRRLLELVAVLGEHASIEALQLAGIDLGPDGSHLDDLLGRELVREVEGGLRVTHPLLRDVVLAETNPLRRAILRERAAGALERVGTDAGRDARSRQLSAAAHRIQGWWDARSRADAASVVRAGLDAARMAERMSAPAVARTLYRGALDAFEALTGPARAEVADEVARAWVAVGNDHVVLGDEAAARDALAEARGLALDPVTVAQAWRGLAAIPYRAGLMERVQEVCREGLGQLPAGAVVARAVLQLELGWAQHRRGDHRAALATLSGPVRVAEEAADWPLAARGLDYHAMTLEALGRYDEAHDVLLAAQVACDRTDDPRRRAILDMHTAAVLGHLDRTSAARLRVAAAADGFDRLGDPYSRSVAHWIAATIEDRAGQYERALAERDAEIRLLEPLGNHLHLGRAHTHRAELLAHLGRDAESRMASEMARRHGRRQAIGT